MATAEIEAPRKRRRGADDGGAAAAKLAESGLTPEQGAALGMAYLEDADAAHPGAGYEARPALRIPYFGLDGGPLAAAPKWPQFERVRYLGPKTESFAAVAGAKERRYAQPPGTGVCAYLPRVLPWKTIASDPARDLVITEGELKASCAAVRGFAAVGLGGVWNFRCPTTGVLFLPELEAIDFRRRRVHVVYDSDARTNPHVCDALNALAEELRLRGALPQMVALPDLPGKAKVGLDDFIVAEGTDAFVALLDEAEPLTMAAELWKLNEEVVYVRDPGVVVARADGRKLAPAAFVAHAYAARVCAERTVKKDGSVSFKRVPAAPKWIAWPYRREAARIVFAPGQPREAEVGGEVCWNDWPGWGVQPKKGDVGLFRRLVDHLFEGADPADRRWFLDWLAWPLQHPGEKLFTAAVVHGVGQGTGKSLLGYTIGKIHGAGFSEINSEHLRAPFNEWLVNKTFILGDDVTGQTSRRDADLLKKLVTQKTLRVNQKYVPSYEVADCANYYFTSNQPDAIFLEDEDRRYFIHEVVADRLPADFARAYDEELWHGGLAAAVFANLLDRNLEKFDPRAAAPATRAKEKMTSLVRSDLGSFVAALREAPDQTLRLGGMVLRSDLYTSAELLGIYDPAGKTKTTAGGVGRELARQGFLLAAGGSPVRVEAEQNRYWAIRRGDAWRKATTKSVAAHVVAARVQGVMKPLEGKKY
ncbi:DUF3854 domain-containing protein [bacterium]|nr:DUF3854 domain-containing protein [bacterium]